MGVDFDSSLDYGAKADLPNHRAEQQIESPCLQKKNYLICAVRLHVITTLTYYIKFLHINPAVDQDNELTQSAQHSNVDRVQ